MSISPPHDRHSAGGERRAHALPVWVLTALPFSPLITTRFVKLFLEGIKQAAGLSKTGMQVFELVYRAMRLNPGSDEIKLNQYVARNSGLSDRTYQRGVRELLEKEFLFRSPSDGVFFVNIRFMFNGDRLAFVKTYHLKDAARQDDRQPELPLLAGPPTPAKG